MKLHQAALRQFFVAALLSGAGWVSAPLFAADSGNTDIDGIVAVSTAGSVRALGVPTFPAQKAAGPTVDVALSPSALGYVTLDRFGAIYAYGDAAPLGAATPPKKGVAAVAVEPTASGAGALVAFADGSVRALGDAPSLPSGSAGRSPVVDAAMTPGGVGLWLLHRSGAVQVLGDAPDIGDAPASSSPATGIAPTPTGQGAWIARADGTVVALGDAVGERGPRAAGAPKVSGIASLGLPDDWLLVDVEGNVERRGEPPLPLPGTNGGVVAVDATASTATVTSAGPEAPWTKIVAPGIVLDTSGDPAGTLVVALPCFVTGGSVPIEEGDVLAAAIGPKTPNGLLRRIISLSACEDGRVLATTEPATLSDALPEGKLELSDDLSGLVVPDFVPTSEDGTIEPAAGAPATSRLSLDKSASTLQSSAAGPPSAVAAGAVGTVAEPGRFSYGCGESGFELKVKPVFSFDPEVTFSADWGSDDEVHIQIGGGLQGEIGGEFSATGSVLCEAKFNLVDDLSLGKKLIFVGPVPVVVEPKLNLAAKLSGKSEAAVKTTASSTGSAGAILHLDREPGFDEVVWDLQPSGSFSGFLDLEGEASIEATFSLTPSIGFLLYGIVAPTASLSSGLKAAYEACESPNLTLRQPASLEVSLKPAEWLGDMLEPLGAIDLDLGHTFSLPGSPYLLYGADVATTIPCVDETELPDGQVGEAYSTAITITMPPGAADPTYTLTDGDLPPGLLLTGDGLLQGTPTQSGIYHFEATATHSLGTSTGKFRITIQQAEALEITTASLPGGTVGEDYLFALQANRPAGELTWAVTGGDLPPGVALTAGGTLSGIPTEAGNYPFTVEATHALSSQTAEKLFSLAVIEDIGGSTLGTEELGVPPADARPDGSTAAILRQDWDPDAGDFGVWTRWRLVKAGPDGQIDFDVDIPAQCTLDVACVFSQGSVKSSVRIMPDGGAAIAILGDGLAFVSRYAPNGDELWQQAIPSIGQSYQIAAFEVAPDGRIALATNEAYSFDTPGLYCDNVDRSIYSYGSIYVEFDADGASIREHEYRTEGGCQEALLGLEEVSTRITGLAVDAGGNFVAVGFTAWLTSGLTYRPTEPFRIDLGLPQPLSVTDGKLPVGLAASGDGLYVALAVAHESGGASFPLLLGGLVDLTATTLAAPLLCPTLSGVAGTPGSLFTMCEDTLGRLSDAGDLVVSRILPVDRLALAVVAGLGGQVFTVERRTVGEYLDPYEIAGGVLNPDLSDPE